MTVLAIHFARYSVGEKLRRARRIGLVLAPARLQRVDSALIRLIAVATKGLLS